VAPLPINNTTRTWVDYHDGFNPHSLLIRHSGGAAAVTEVLGMAAVFLGALSPQMYVISITGARYSVVNTTVSLPVAWPGAATYGSGAMPAVRRPFQICYLARSAGGRMVRWFIFGCKLEAPANYRYELSASTELQDGWDVLSESQDVGAFLAIDGLNPTLYSYVDANWNSYHEEKARG
jgi:hypothetical protein